MYNFKIQYVFMNIIAQDHGITALLYSCMVDIMYEDNIVQGDHIIVG